MPVPSVPAKSIRVAILQYPESSVSGAYGLLELLQTANRVSEARGVDVHFAPTLISSDAIDDTSHPHLDYALVLLPPGSRSSCALPTSPALLDWLRQQHGRGALLASACAGAFILARTGLADGRALTTHWALAKDLQAECPAVRVQADDILLQDGDVLSAGGVMSWVDLGLEIVAQFAGPSVMRELGKILVVDTGPREQRYYRQFRPARHHGDAVILRLQNTLEAAYASPITVAQLAEAACLSERTLLRRFVKATGLKPKDYLQRVRVQKACDLLEGGNAPFETVARQVGYEDVGACRKVFVKIMGLTPRDFKKRFAAAPVSTQGLRQP